MKKEPKVDYSTPEGIRLWRQQCGFSSDAQASAALGVPFRTYCRWKALGAPHGSFMNKLATEAIVARMEKILAKATKK